MQKKVLIFSLNYYPRFIGGAEIAIKEITKRLTEYEWYMITLRFDSNLPRYELIENVHVYRIGFSFKNPTIHDLKKNPLNINKYIYQIYAAIFALFLNRKIKFDIVWAMMAHSCAIPAGIFKFFNKNIKYILSLQEGDPLDYIERKFRFVWFFFKYGFISADVIQSISTFLKEWGLKIGNKNINIVIPNGVNMSIENNFDQKLFNNIKNKIIIKNNKYLITTSRLVYKNAIDDVIRSLVLLPENIHFIILGIGPDEEKLKLLVKELMLEHRVYFLGEVENDLIIYYLKSCDVFIRPSRSEGMGNSFIEAMYARIPVIATTEGGLKDFIYDKKTALVVRPNMPLDIKVAVENLLFDKVLRNKIIENAYRMVKRKYDWDIIAKDMKDKVFK